MDISRFKEKIGAQQQKSVDDAINELLGQLHSYTTEAPKVPIRQDRYLTCLNCNTSLESVLDKCPKCNADLTKARTIGCPKCRGWVTWEDLTCPDCHKDLTVPYIEEKVTPVEPLKPKVRELKHTATPMEIDRGARAQCSSCGNIIAISDKSCPHCGVAFEDIDHIQKPEAPKTFAGPVNKLEQNGSGLREISKRFQSSRPKPQITTTVPVASRVSRRGLSNGVGETNGLSFVNGKKPDSKSYVNGTGVSNGLRASRRKGTDALTITRMMTNWKFLVILISIMMVIPTFVYISNSHGGPRISVDGTFNDWSDVTKFGMMTHSSVTSVNILDWSVDTYQKELYVYAKAQGALMGGPEVESLFVYVDSDNSSSTGYSVQNLGADYLLELDGWNGSIASASLSRYGSVTDQYDWNSWTSLSGALGKVANNQLEASATLPDELEPGARFMLVSKNGQDAQSASYAVPMKGGLLVVRQIVPSAISTAGNVASGDDVLLLSLEFSCQGKGGTVQSASPSLLNATLGSSISSFTLDPGAIRTFEIRGDLAAASTGDLVSAAILPQDIVSSFSNVQILGTGMRAYLSSAPGKIAVDGAFGDWIGKITAQPTGGGVTNPNLDIDAIGCVNDTFDSYFYVSVSGDICSGTFVPVVRSKPSGPGGGGIVIPQRRTAEDETKVLIDVDNNKATGLLTTLDSMVIGADEMVLVKGLYGRIVSVGQYHYQAGWQEGNHTAKAANDRQRLEIGVNTSSIGDPSQLQFVIQTTSWKGLEDSATCTAVPDPWTITTGGVDSRSPGDGTWNDGSSISLVSGDSVVDMDIGDGQWVYAVTNSGRVHQWQVGTSTSWSSNVTDPINGTANIVAIAAYKSGMTHSAFILASDGRLWSITKLGVTGKAWAYKDKVWGGITDFADLDIKASNGEIYAIRSAANSLAYWAPLNLGTWHITAATGSTSPQTHVVYIPDNFQIDERILILCENGNIRNSSNGGNSWNGIGNLPEPTGGNATTSRYVGMEFDGSGYLWVITASGWCYVSTDTTTLNTFISKGRATTTSGITAITCPIPELQEILPAVLLLAGIVVISQRRRRRDGR